MTPRRVREVCARSARNRDRPMSPIEDAFDFLFEFDDGNIELEIPIPPNYVENIRLLSTDLLAKNVDVSGLSMPEVNALLSEMASVNTRWNHGLQECLDQAYRHAEQGLLDDAAVVLNSFMKDCPSRFYAEIASDVKEEILGRESG